MERMTEPISEAQLISALRHYGEALILECDSKEPVSEALRVLLDRAWQTYRLLSQIRSR